MTDSNVKVVCNDDSIEIVWGCGSRSSLPNLWLRHNCDCETCRAVQTTERIFFLSDVPADLAPTEVDVVDDCLRIVWPDGHQTAYHGDVLRAALDKSEWRWSPWPDGFVPEHFDYAGFLENDGIAVDAISAFMSLGAIVLSDAPDAAGTLEELEPRLGPVRELLFERIHDVQVDPAGYNIAHTPLPLPPHNDFASYTWPPSVQALHMLANEVSRGESIIVDGWSVLKALRHDHPEYFRLLCRVPVPFREFDENTETYAVEPIVRCGLDGDVEGFRFSNQLMQAIDPNHPDAVAFYRAYHELCCRVADPQVRATFRLCGGEILIVAAHRVLHGRKAFEPTGRRHLQDAYFELDHVQNHLVVLQRKGAS
jgi:gamma-butyrobetaine dioxygenase